MAIERMKLVRINGPSKKLNEIIRLCCEDGNFHCENASDFISESMGYSVLTEENPYAEVIAMIKEQADAFNFDLDSDKEFREIELDKGVKKYLEQIGEKLTKLREEQKVISEQYTQCSNAIEKYSHFKGLNIRLEEIFNCEYISIRFGHLPKDGYIKLLKAYKDDPYVLFCPCSKDDSGYWGAYFEPRDRAGDVDKIFASLHFERLYIPAAVGTTDEVIEKLNENMEIIALQKAELEEKIAKILSTEGEKIIALYRDYIYFDSIFELRKNAVHHNDSCFMVGWIPAKDEKKFMKKMKKKPEFIVGIEDPEKEAKIQPPTKLKSAFWSEPFSFFINLYGLPSYNDLDVTSFVAVTYILFFGIMFGDLGQGAVLAIGGFFAWKKMKIALGKILVPCGLCSMVFGFIFGSVFGFEHALNPVYEMLGWGEKPVEVMESINLVLLTAIAIGITLVITSMVINIISCLKKKLIGKAIFSENGVAGIMIYIGGANFAYGFMAGTPIFPNSIGMTMAGIGLLCAYNKELICPLIDEKKFHKPESIPEFMVQNFFECVEYILSYFSNTLSYLRIGAYVIVHASMMMVVFTIAGDPKSLSGILIIIFGNIFVICLEGLLTGIQGLRLEFYEMFSRFYEGEGRPFEAAKLNTGEKTK